MGEQRRGRGGRGRSGRGGRIPRKGEQGYVASNEEAFVSFPLDVTGPIRVVTPLADTGVGDVVRETLGRERAYVAALAELVRAGAEGGVAKLQVEAERHRDQLEQLARDLGADVSGAAGEAVSASVADVFGAARQVHTGWQTLQRAAYMFGDKRIDRVVKPALREKARHLDVLESAALRSRAQVLVKEMEF